MNCVASQDAVDRTIGSLPLSVRRWVQDPFLPGERETDMMCSEFIFLGPSNRESNKVETISFLISKPRALEFDTARTGVL